MKTQAFLRLLLGALGAMVVGCADTSLEPAPPVTGAGKLHSQFLDARSRMDQPYLIAGESDEGRYYAFAAQLKQLGDDRFAAELSKESPEVIAAVSWFVSFDLVNGDYPRTRRLLDSAPDILFEAARVTEEDASRP